MDYKIEIYNFKNNDIRLTKQNEEPWFVAKDVCNVLELTDVHKSVELLDEDERNIIPVIDTLGRKQKTYVINEPGLYSLILRSRKPEAKTFKRWVTHEVLPSIRRTGGYKGNTSSARSVLEGVKTFGSVMSRKTKRHIMRRYFELIGEDPELIDAEVENYDYASADSLIERFINEQVVPEDGARLSREDFYSGFRRWCKANGEPAPSRCRAIREVNRLGRFRSGRSNNVRYWEGVNLL